MRRRYAAAPSINPYIALADLLLNLALILVLLFPLILLLGSRGWDETRYKAYQQLMESAIHQKFPTGNRPHRDNRNDAPGEQRWGFNSIQMYEPQRNLELPRLSREGRLMLRKFADVLNAHRDADFRIWWRIRVESHMPQYLPHPTRQDEVESLRITADRAIVVSQYLFEKCGINPWEITTSGRGYQDLLDREDRASRKNERIDLLIIPPPLQRRK
jgi:hypothetical protein